MIAAWNAQERAGGDYSPDEWSPGSLATARALMFAARQVLRNEWEISNLIAAEHPGGGFAQLAEAETNYWEQHVDYPPHLHINYIWPGWSGHVNTHFNTTEDGKVRQPFLIWHVPGCPEGSTYPAAGEWWAEIDEACRPVWFQRWTEDGAIELKLREDAPVYRLSARDIANDLSAADVYGDGHLIYSIDISAYDPINLHMVVQITDHRNQKLITETFTGTTEPWNTLTGHTVEEAPLPPPPSTAHGCTYVVSTTGDDNSPGTLEEPWLTVSKAASTATAGDKVCFRAGTWNERLVPVNSGMAAAPITFTAFPGEEHQAVLDLGHETGRPTYEGIVHVDATSYVVVENLKITRAEDFGVFVRASDNILIRNNLIDYTWNSGIFVVRSQGITVEGNDLQRVTHRNGGHPGHESISVLGGTNGFEIRYNRIHNPYRNPDTGEAQSKEGIDAKDGVSNGRIYGNYVNLGNSIGIYVDAFSTYATNIEIFNNELVGNSIGLAVASEQRGTVDGVTIYNNIIHHNRQFGIRITGWEEGGPARNLRVVNNTLFANGGFGIEVSNSEIENVLIRNNISVGHTMQNLIVGGTVPTDRITVDYNLVEDDPQFLDAEGGDFHLLPTSPAIDAGSPDGVPRVDRDGATRPFGPGYDIGAYEAAGKEWMQPWIDKFYEAGITTGCAVDGAGNSLYCPDREVTRAEMAVFLLRALNYPNLPYTPPDQSGMFADVPVAGKEWMEPWIEEFYDLGITTGCAADPLRYCPEREVTRAEMAVFILRAKYGGSYQSPAASGTFEDVPVAGKEWMEPWIEEFYAEGITTGCAAGPLQYCPERPVTRAEMAVFILRAFDKLPMP